MLVTLLVDQVLAYEACRDRFGISQRAFQRDLRELRAIGADFGFSISPMKAGRAFLYAPVKRVERLGVSSREVQALLAGVAGALGEPVAGALREVSALPSADCGDGFLHVRAALASDGGRVAMAFAELREASAQHARVEFAYTSARGGRSQRRVEPYHVIVRAGRSYLVGYDLVRRDWRYFALDAIGGPIRRDGMFAARAVPERFLAQRAVGWFGGGEPIEVTVWLSPIVAASVLARRWQEGQQTATRADGSGEITLVVADVGEAVRWALSFGAEARVIAPPPAVGLAREIAERVARAYDRDTLRLSQAGERAGKRAG